MKGTEVKHGKGSLNIVSAVKLGRINDKLGELRIKITDPKVTFSAKSRLDTTGGGIDFRIFILGEERCCVPIEAISDNEIDSFIRDIPPAIQKCLQMRRGQDPAIRFLSEILNLARKEVNV